MARLSKGLLLLLALCLPVLPVRSQPSRNAVSVSGVVRAEGQNQAIQHVKVRLCDSGGNLVEETITSDDGQFYFRNLQRSPYILTFEAAGFENSEMHLDLSFMSDRGMTVYLKPVAKESAPAAAGASISAHELSMPESARNLVMSGRKKLYQEKKADLALKDFQEAVKLAPGYYEAYGEMAMAYVSMGQTQEALGSFRRSIEASHDSYGDAYVGLGTVLIEKGDIAEGEKNIRHGVELNPKAWRGFYELGKLELGRNHLDAALKSAEQAKALAPNAPMVYRLLANIHLREKNNQALLGDLDAYIKLDPNSPAGVRAAQMREELVGQGSGPKPQ
jgi:tetratricopeptide (TPR) repeat protein